LKKETARKNKRKLDGNTKYYLKITGWDDVEGINLAQDKV
jgi:hypothetical protein